MEYTLAADSERCFLCIGCLVIRDDGACMDGVSLKYCTHSHFITGMVFGDTQYKARPGCCPYSRGRDYLRAYYGVVIVFS